MKKNWLHKILLFVWLFAPAFPLCSRADEFYKSGEVLVVVSGEFTHSKLQDVKITGAPAGREKAFRREIYGDEFVLSVSNLNAGNYAAVFGFSENHFDHAGERNFDINRNTASIVTNFDIYAAAGGKGRTVFVTNVFEYKKNSEPLAFDFTATRNQAKLNTFELRTAEGASIILLEADDLAHLSDADDLAAQKIPAVEDPAIWKDATQPLPARVNDLVRRMSLAEKVSQLRCDAIAVPRLGIAAYSYRNECLHGVENTGFATVFPQAIGMAAAWDPSLIHEEADVIATEARAVHNDYAARHNGDSGLHFGLSFYSPNINIFRDPRWGRGQETYGEDPFLTSQTGVAFIRGLQGDDPKYFKVIACAKHYAVHSGPEFERHRFNVEPSDRDLYETYLPAFEAAVREGHVDSVMGAYSALHGIPDCANHFLLTELLRDQWGFKGYVVSDGGAIGDINRHHKFVRTPEEAAADAVKAGDDLCSGGGNEYGALTRAVARGLISEAGIDIALRHGLEARFRLGLFDPADQVPFAKTTLADNDTAGHRALARKVADESIVLLKNDGLLPFERNQIKTIAVIGANAASTNVLLGNYHGKPSRVATILEGIRSAAGNGVKIIHEKGCPLALRNDNSNQPHPDEIEKTVAVAASADVIIYVGGIDPSLEAEETRVDYQGFNEGDRTRIELPAVQEELLKKLHATGKPVVFVNCSGSAIAIPWAAAHLPAIVQAWYPGEEGGRAVADVLFGEVNPAGRLPVTFYRSTEDLPPFEDYSMSNRTYRYFNGPALFAFGHGHSYTKFDYDHARLNAATFNPDETARLAFALKNSGPRDGDEVAQVYFCHVHSSAPQAKLALCQFTRIHLKQNQESKVELEIPLERFRCWNPKQNKYEVEAGDYELLIGSASDDIRLRVPFSVVSAKASQR